MDPITAAVILGGTAITSALNFYNQRRSERVATGLANTAVQRRYEDMKKAGINPILAAQGQGANVPVIQPVRFENFGDTYATAQRVSNESQLVEEQRAKLKADTAVSEKQLDVMEVSMTKTTFDNAYTLAQTRLTNSKADQEEVWGDVFRIIGNSLAKYLGTGHKNATLETVLRHLLELFKVPDQVIKADAPSETMWDLYQSWKKAPSRKMTTDAPGSQESNTQPMR